MSGTAHAADFVTVREGGRIKAECSIHADVKAVGPHECHWRTIVCEGDWDICECSECGDQRVFRCDFDEEYD